MIHFIQGTSRTVQLYSAPDQFRRLWTIHLPLWLLFVIR